VIAGISAFAGLAIWSDGKTTRDYAEKRDAEWNGPCADTATLLATTSGSPSELACPNKRHKMRVTLASAPSNEEFGAVVFCECQR
jgi:hypothetical protein